MMTTDTSAIPEQRTTTVDVDGVPVTVTRVGTGHPVLILHGGGGPLTVLPWAVGYAAARDAEVIVPVHPGFSGTPRPETLRTPRDLAGLYVGLLDALGLEQVTVVGNSIGGWIAAEIAALGSPRVTGVVVVDAVGLVVPGHPYPDFFSLTPAEVAARSYHDPEKFGVDPAKLPPEVRAAMAGNRAALGVYGGGVTDTTLASRLSSIDVPVLVVWGAADRIGDPEVGEAYAKLIPGARLEVIADAGHLPQIESPSRLTELVGSWTGVMADSAPPA
jgi:pimeloyl-ACP methyl ester carboxylesterase